MVERLAGTGRRCALVCIAVCLSLLWRAAWAAPAIELQLPLTIPYGLLDGLTWQPTSGAGAVEFQDGPCRRLRIETSRLEPRAGELHLISRVAAALGVELLGRCIEPIGWRGTVDARLQPVIDSAGILHFHLGDTELRDPEGDPAPLASFVWDLSQRFIDRHLQSFGFDLQPPREQVSALLSAVVAPQALAELQVALAGLQFGATRAEAVGLRIVARVTLPGDAELRWFPPPPPESGKPSHEELTRIGLERVDAFLLEVVKRLADDVADPELRQRLTTLLLESRYRLVNILDDPAPHGTDPVRELLTEDWEQLRTLVAAAELQAGGGSRLLRFAAFINAGDILRTLDDALPSASLWVSATGLRAALRELTPNGSVPALDYDYRVDPALRELFGLPPESPPLPVGDDDVDEDEPARPGDAVGAELRGAALDRGASFWGRLLDGLITDAEAAAPDRIGELQKAIGRRVPSRDQLAAYAQLIDELLAEIAQSELAGRELTDEQGRVFGALLPATAFIESCWRQFKRDADRVTYLVSGSGAVGMLQINARVWRGLYDVERLRWEVAYNARAGAQILLHYLEGPGLDVVRRSGESAYLARATYAAYNAGPGGAGRFLGKDGGLKPGPVDRRFWSYFQAVAADATPDLETCTFSKAGKGTSD